MISSCPNCGHRLGKAIVDGITQCFHCNRVVSTTLMNELLSAAWEARRGNLSPESIEWQTKLEKDFANLIYHFVCVAGYSHDEFLSFLKKLQLLTPKS